MINIDNATLVLLKKILKEHIPNNTVWLFGSRTTNNIKPHSDIDLAIITQEPLTIRTMRELTDAMTESDLLYKVDIVDWSTIDDGFKKIIRDNHAIIQ